MASKKDTIKLSASRISMFLQCKYKYWCRYIDHKPRIFNPVFALGLACHEALELAGNLWMKDGKLTKEDKNKIIEKYDEVAVREGMIDFAVHAEGKDLIKKRINNFDIGRKIIGLEIEFGSESGNKVITKDGVELIGAIDKAVEVDDDTLLIVDYKTSKTAPDVSQLKNDLQLSIYNIAAGVMWPQYKRIILSLDLLKHDILYTYRTDEEKEEFINYLKAIHKNMSELKKKDAKPSINMFCYWCDFKEDCDGYKEACKKHDYLFSIVADRTEAELFEEWNSVRDTKKILEGREKELSMVLIKKIKEGDSIEVNGKELYIRQNTRHTYDLKTIYDAVPPEDFPELVNVNKKAVDKYISNNPSVKERIINGSTTNFTSPFLATKKVKIDNCDHLIEENE